MVKLMWHAQIRRKYYPTISSSELISKNNYRFSLIMFLLREQFNYVLPCLWTHLANYFVGKRPSTSLEDGKPENSHLIKTIIRPARGWT